MFILKVSAFSNILLNFREEAHPPEGQEMYGTNVIIPNGD